MTKPPEDVLVVGDWYVDAHWVVAPHESETASRPGEHHSLAVHGRDATVRALCGAGQVASILHACDRSNTSLGKVYGLGSWAPEDNSFIQALVEGKNKSDNPLKLKSSIRADKANHGRVFNLSRTDKEAGTNRVIRIYRRASANDYKLVERIDFATQLAPCTLECKYELPKSIRYILVKDHGRGIVTRDLIASIVKKAPPGALWYISTKRWSSTGKDGWLGELRNRRVELILFQHEAAAKATTTDDTVFPEVGNWLVAGKVPTRRALAAIDGALNAFMNNRRRDLGTPAVVVLPSRESLLACASGNNGNQGYVYVGAEERPEEAFVPRASALFASLFYQHRQAGASPDWIGAMKRALKFTAIWARVEANRITQRNWTRNGAVLGAGDKGIVAVDRHSPNQKEQRSIEPKHEARFNWETVRRDYRQSFMGWPRRQVDGEAPGFGVILRDRDPEHSLELWRAMTDAKDVISIVRAKRHMLVQLSNEFDQFMRARKQCKSFMIVDDPGGGKSTLVKAIAAAKNLRVLPVNITELTRRVDLLAFFDTIVTTQATDPSQPLLIFVDEINALLEGHTVYSSFLAPLEDGHYNRDGKSFTIQPCIWVFVGTDDLGRKYMAGDESGDLGSLRGLEEDVRRTFVDSKQDRRTATPSQNPGAETSKEEERYAQTDRAQKKSDFLSRLTMKPFVLNQPFTLPPKARDVGAEVVAAEKRLRKLMKGTKETRGTEAVDRMLADLTAALSDEQAEHTPEGLAKRLLGRRLLREGHALERVYVGAKMMTDMKPSVTHISLRILMALAYLDDTFTLRDLRHDLEHMSNVRGHVIRWENLPESFHQRARYLRLDRKGALRIGTYGKVQLLDELCPVECDGIEVRIDREPHTSWTGSIEAGDV